MTSRARDAGSPSLDWTAVAAALDDENHVVIPGALDAAAIADLLDGIDPRGPRAKPLRVAAVTPLGRWRAAVIEPLAAIAADWDRRLGLPMPMPMPRSGPAPARDDAILLRIGEGDDGPLQGQASSARPRPLPFLWTALLGEPGRDFDGGDLILTERRPRMQSRPFVVPLRRGDAAIVVCGRRPRAGSRGDYPVEVKAGIGRVRSGERIGLDLFLDAASRERA